MTIESEVSQNHVDSASIPSDREQPAPPPAVDLPSHVYFKDDLKFHDRDESDSRMRGVLEDTQANKFYRLGAAEFALVKCLKSNASLAEARKLASELDRPLNHGQVQRLVQWIQLSGLTRGSDQPDSDPSAASRKATPISLLSQLFFLRVPILNPDDALGRVAARFSGLFSWQASTLALVVALLGTIVAASSWSEFLDSYENLFTPWRGLWLLGVWFALKVLHECAHAITCRRYGGNVPSAGVAFILLMPIAFVDVSSCWRFDSKWKRLHVTLAGVIAELFIAGIAMFVWLYFESPIIRNAAADVVLAASFSTLLFNLNPLLKFDGYFALADVTGVDNLYQYGQSYARYFGSRYILGLSSRVPRLPHGHEAWIKVYGICAAFWRFVTISGLIMGAAAMFAGAGILLAITGVIAFVVIPLVKLVTHLQKIRSSGEVQWGRVAARLLIIGALIGGGLFLIPSEIRRTNPGIVEYDPPSVLHAPVDGFVRSIFVEDGQFVDAGDPILELRNDELDIEQRELSTKLNQTRQRMRSARWKNDSSALEEEMSRVEGLEAQLWELRRKTDSLVVRAPHAGHVVSRVLRLMPGQYVEQGTEIGAVGNENSKRIKVSLSTWEANRSAQWLELPAIVSIAGRTTWTATVSKLASRASEIPPDPSLTAPGGGPLVVKQKDGVDDPVLVERRVNAFITLSPEQSRNVLCGQRCAVRIRCWRQSLGAKLVAYLDQQFWDVAW